MSEIKTRAEQSATKLAAFGADLDLGTFSRQGGSWDYDPDFRQFAPEERSHLLKAGIENKNRAYVLLGTTSGTSPGILLPGGSVSLPLNWDYFMLLVTQHLNTQLFHNFQAKLNTYGVAMATFDTLQPLPPGSAGTVMHFAYALNVPWDFVSNPVVVEILP